MSIISSTICCFSRLRLTNSLLYNTAKLSLSSEKTDLNCRAPKNEPILDYSNGDSKQRVELEKCLRNFQDNIQEIPIIIKGKEFRTDQINYQSIPFDHRSKLAQFYHATPKQINEAIKASLDTKHEWEFISLEEKCLIFEKAADLISGKYRQLLNAATILGQGKTIKQAEIDSACELADFLRFNAYYAKELKNFQQPISTEYENNSIDYRGLDGFIAAISPFNFTAIGGNLVAAPALMSNCLIWKPSDTAILSNYLILKAFQEAGLPDGVINFVPSEPLDFGRLITGNEHLGGVNFTGSLATFRWLWNEIGLNIKSMLQFPRLIGECGGKNYHFIHNSANFKTALSQTIRSAFEYSGQKCSACSRLYVPASIWFDAKFKDELINIVENKIKLGPANDFNSYTSAVIDAKAFNRIKNYINYANSLEGELKLLSGGEVDDEIGYYVKPTIFETNNPNSILMREEIFGPLLTVYPYLDEEEDQTLDLINSSTPFALTGAIFAQDEAFITKARRKLRFSAGNFYINDKSTGAVVGQQPFGGARLSGTNDKAGGVHYLMRWCNQQTIKRTTINLEKY